MYVLLKYKSSINMHLRMRCAYVSANKFCSIGLYPWTVSSSKLESWCFQVVMANFEMFVSSEQLSLGVLVKCAILFANSCNMWSGTGFPKHVTFSYDRLLDRCLPTSEQSVRIL